jgi:NTP pyrophosphatase (non-canonical NTP hydrolase)
MGIRPALFNDIPGDVHASNQELVYRWCVAKGWYDEPVPFLSAMALLVSEIAEIAEDYGREGLLGGWQARPHTASEFADCYIRLLDYCERYGIALAKARDIYQHTYVQPAIGSMDRACMCLVQLVVKAMEAYRVHGLVSIGEAKFAAGAEIAKCLARFYIQLQHTCDFYGVDLAKEFDKKMAVNWQRPYRHGNKHA